MGTIRRLDRLEVVQNGETMAFVTERLLGSEAPQVGRLLQDSDFTAAKQAARDFVKRHCRDVVVIDEAREYLPEWPAKGRASEDVTAEDIEARERWLDGVCSELVPFTVARMALQMRVGNVGELSASVRSRESFPDPTPASGEPSDA